VNDIVLVAVCAARAGRLAASDQRGSYMGIPMRPPGVVIVATLCVLFAAPALAAARLDMLAGDRATIIWEGGSDVRTSNTPGAGSTTSTLSSLGDLTHFRVHVSKTPADVYVAGVALLVTGNAIPDPDTCGAVAPAAVCGRIQPLAGFIPLDNFEDPDAVAGIVGFYVYLQSDGQGRFRFSTFDLDAALQLVQTFDPAELHVGLSLDVPDGVAAPDGLVSNLDGDRCGSGDSHGRPESWCGGRDAGRGVHLAGGHALRVHGGARGPAAGGRECPGRVGARSIGGDRRRGGL
jgi:hypothetical protein